METKVIVAGSRGFTNYEVLHDVLNIVRTEMVRMDKKMVIVSGCARGADQMGERYARQYSLRCILMPAKWDEHGRSAGYKRNVEMSKIADMAVVFWDQKSLGAKHMIDIMKAANKLVQIRDISHL